MIIQNLAMNRESRKILNNLELLAQQNGTSTLVTSTGIYIAEQVSLKYYTAPILNMIKSKVKQLKNKSSKHFTIEHWVSVLDSIFSDNMSVRRGNSVVQVVDGNDIGNQGFQVISKYLPTDYSINDAELIYKVIHTYESHRIQSACKIAISNNVYNIQYVNAILEKEQALSNIKKHGIEELNKRAENASEILNRQKIQHTVMDVASSKYDWEQQKQNAELERRMQELLGGE